MRRLILCSDDFAFSPAVSQTIADLARAGKLNAIGCMAGMPNWPTDSALLADLPPYVEIGLHLTLTEERPLTAMPMLAPDGILPGIGDLRRRIGHLPLDEIAAEVTAQFDAFMTVMGRPPAFVDGHQHSHALPGIRDIVLAETARRAPHAWLRNPADRLRAMLARPFRGKAIGSALHARGFARAAAAKGLATNDGFAGHYDFTSDYAALFPQFLRRPGKQHLVMCHPGDGLRENDAIGSARPDEAKALRALDITYIAAQEGLAFPA
ncbi:ChbG/HpnK family deacetylase [Sphingomonas floccifaciens]|uniref:ChbG/HpnK family deacetylase n=1 Tax=Sphingomonas floccifaciens TaxID=1844115 RepID=A0ABW4NDV5_9SPHN